MTNKKISALTGASISLSGVETLPIVQSGATVNVAVNRLFYNASYGDIAIAYNAAAVIKIGISNSDTTASAGAAYTSYYTTVPITSIGHYWTGGSFMSNLDYYSEIEYKRGGTRKFRMTADDNLEVSTAAKGINFTANTPAAGMTSQLLNWYEEGTATATLTCGTGSITLSTDQLLYTRVGRTVLVNGLLVISTVSTPTGTLTLNGLPFNIGNSNANVGGGGIFVYNATAALANSFVMMRGVKNTTTIVIAVLSLGSDSPAAGFMQAGTQLMISFSYQV